VMPSSEKGNVVLPFLGRPRFSIPARNVPEVTTGNFGPRCQNSDKRMWP
jgi:hypothetical protein